MNDKITGPLFKWFGSKWTASKHYPMPEHESVVEPFAGGAGYSLRHFTKKVTIAETDPHISQLWKWIVMEATETDVRAIPLGLTIGTDIREVGLSHGQALLLKTWQRTNNVGSCWTISSWGNLSGQWTENTRSRVASEINLVKHWKVTDDGFALMKNHCDLATWFVDPPYQFNYQYRGSAFDYASLATHVASLNGQIIVCEAVCPKTQAVPNWLPFVPFRETVTSRRKTNNNHHSKELVFTR